MRRQLLGLLRGLPARLGRKRGGLLTAGVLAVVGLGTWLAFGPGGGPDGSDRSIGQVVSGFFQAQRDGDCERLLDLVTEDSWSDGGRRSRSEFLEQCADAVEGYDPGVEQVEVELQTLDEDGEYTSDPSPTIPTGWRCARWSRC